MAIGEGVSLSRAVRRRMNPEGWARVSRVFDQVADRPSEERAALLDELCGGDAELRREVETLLAASSDASMFLEQPFAPPAPEIDAGAAAPRHIGPYRVLREIGRGGMGVVYLARHQAYPKAVALKVVRPGIDSELLLARFRRERDILAAFEHPGIARLHDAGTAEDGTPYLAMEHVEGTALLEWADSRRLSTRARVELFLDVCAAVDYAHQRQILHRDLKPSNILVTADGKPKLLDFGVAKLLESDETVPGETTLTAAALMTPEYASPEQVRGEPLGPPSDVYALGVVLYELLTGARPYRLANRSHREIERAVCETDPQKPSTMVTGPGLRGDLDAIVLKALRKDAAARYGSVGELAADLRRHLGGFPVRARRGTWRYRGAKFLRRHRGPVAATGLALAALLAGQELARIQEGRPAVWKFRLGGGETETGVEPVRSVAILAFTNLSGEARSAWISATLAEMLRTELAASNSLRVISGDRVAQALQELRLAPAGSLDAAALAGLRRRLGSDLVLLGSYLDSPAPGGALRVDLRVLDCRDGRAVAEMAQSGTSSSILELVSWAGLALRSRLGVTLSTEGEAGLRAWRPSSLQAASAYAEGVAALRRFDYLRARPLLERAIAAEPGYAPAHLELALLLAAQGYQTKAEESARAALRLAPPAPRKARLEVEARVQFVLQNWDGATSAYRALRDLDPENLEVGLELARAEYAGGRAADAVATLAALRTLPPPARDDPRIDLQEGRISTDAEQSRRALAAALAKGEALGATLVVAQARWWEAVGSASRGDRRRDVAAMEEARQLFEQGGDRVGAARATAMIGYTRFLNGDPQGGATLLRSAISSPGAADLPAARRYALTLLGFVEEGRAEWPAAREAFEAARVLSHELGNTIEPVQAAQVALIDFFLGRGADSRRGIEQARAELASHPTWLSDVSYLLAVTEVEDDPALAARLAGERMAADRDAGADLSALAFQRLLGYAQLQRGEIGAARSSLEEAAAGFERRGQVWDAVQTRLALAEALLAAGDAAAAETTARAASEAGRPWTPLSPFLPSGSTVLCRALLAQGRIEEAGVALGPAWAAAGRGASPLHRLAVGVDRARWRAARGEAKPALADLEKDAASAAGLGYRLTALRARLARGEILLGVDRGRGEEALHAVAIEARDAGFGEIAARAESTAVSLH
jgi:tRNA A-37 threonylcarbamoyl transferase component Bud32/tetratricopeptide (TPR) repeat protein/TolB-like protein